MRQAKPVAAKTSDGQAFHYPSRRSLILQVASTALQNYSGALPPNPDSELINPNSTASL
jgi:hypothetical protein